MAKFEFNKSKFQGGDSEWNYEVVGVFGKLPAMKGQRVTFTKGNLKKDTRVTLQIFDASYPTLKEAIEDKAEINNLSCTGPLSKIVRNGLTKGLSQKKMLQYLLTLEIQQEIGKPEKYFLFQESGDGEALPTFVIDELNKESRNAPVKLDDVVF